MKPRTPNERTAVRAALLAARALILDPKHWCVGACAKDAQGEEVAPDDARAVSFCIVGAMWKITGEGYPFPYALNLLCELSPVRDNVLHDGIVWPADGVLIEWNDGVATHQDVLALLAKGAEACH